MTLSRLKESLAYNPETGVFTWLDRRRGTKAGQDAGHVDYQGYRRIGIDGKTHQAHRLAWFYFYGEMPLRQIDHINGDKTDNRITNLRDVAQRENSKNRAISKSSKSGVHGVTFIRANRKWRAAIGVGGRDLFLGYFIDKFEAIAARKSAENKYHYHPNHGARR